MTRRDTGASIFTSAHTGPHEGVVPTDILRGRKALCTIASSAPSGWEKRATPWRVSPFGIDVVDEDGICAVGDSVTVDLRVGSTHTKIAATITAREVEDHRPIASLRFCKRVDGSHEHRPRADTRYACDPFYAPTVETRVEGRFASVMYFRADELSLRGMRLLTSARNRKIIPGSKMRVRIMFPMGGTLEASLVVRYAKWAHQGSRSQMVLGVEIEDEVKDYTRHAGQYLLEFGSQDGLAPSPKILRQMGFISKTRGAHLEFSYVRSKEEYEEVLRLRALSFAENEEGRRWQYWADKFDTHSRILIGRFRGKILCSGRITFQKNSDALEQCAYVKMPAIIPRNTPLTEINRVCTHPDYRGEDLMAYLFRFVVMTMLESQQRYMVINCTDQLLRMYESIGCKRTGTSFVHPNDRSRHHVLFSNIYQTVYGRKIHPLKWMLTIGEIWDEIIPYVPEESTRIDRARLRVLLRARPVLRPLLAAAMNRRRPPAGKPPRAQHTD